MNRLKWIDVLRAVAIFLVIGRHMKPCPQTESAILHEITSIWFQGGWIGVDLFFVLSGFLVAGLLFREYENHDDVDLKRFLIRRGFKIYPPFWLLMGVSVLVFSRQNVSLSAVGYELAFLQNYGPALWNHTWSLAVEEHFYLLLAFGVFIMTRGRSPLPFRLVPVAFVSVAMLCLALRLLVHVHTPFSGKTHLFPSHLRLDGLFFGVFLAYLMHRHPASFLATARRFRWLLLVTGALLLLPAFCFPLESTPFIYTYGLSLFYLGSGCLLVSALGFQSPTTRVAKAIAYVGSHSYSVYLWHMPIALWVPILAQEFLADHYGWFVYASICTAGSVAFGIGMGIVTEFPILRMRDRLFPSRGTPFRSEATRSSGQPLVTVANAVDP